MSSRGVVDLDAYRRRKEQAAQKVRTEEPPDKLVDDVLGPDDRYFDVARRLDRATGLEWSAPGAIGRMLAAFVKEVRR